MHNLNDTGICDDVMNRNSSLRPPYGTVGFASNTLPRNHRLTAWEHHNATSLVALQAAPSSTTTFAATGFNLNTPSVDVARVQCTPHKVARTEHEISAHPVQGAVVYINLDRQGTFWHRQRRFDVQPGQIVVVDGDQAFEREFRLGTDEYVFRIPRHLLSDATSQRNLATPQLFDPDARQSTGRAAVALRGLATSALTQQYQDWEGLATKTASLLALLLGHQPQNLFDSALEFIRQRCTDSGFGAPELAATLGISTRQLSRVFAANETSVAQELLQAKLEAAHRMLGHPHHASTSIAALAASCGFTSQAHFSRSYRTAYGYSPLQHRKMLLASSRVDSSF